MTIQIADLDLTDALEASLEAQLKINDTAEVDRVTAQMIKQATLEALLPVLPYVIKQVGSHAWREGHAACDRDWEFTADLTTPDEDRQPFTNPYDNYPLEG